MKKITKLSIISIVIVVALLVLWRIKATTNFTIEWHEIKPQTFAQLKPLLEPLPAITTQAFIPVVKPYTYANDPRLAHIAEQPAGQQLLVEQKVVEGITQSLQNDWNKKITNVLLGLENNELAAAHIAIAYDSAHKPRGFALFKETPISEELKKLVSLTQGSSEHIQNTHDEIFVDLLAVLPDTQGKGVGKALLLSILDGRPHIKKIYLRTFADDANKKTQGFYEHVGFTRLLTGTWESTDKDDLKREKSLYLYQRP